MASFENRVLGRTGIPVGPLGISSSFGAEAAAYEEAFERGCNYFTWGTFMKGRSAGMREAMRNIIRSGKRDQLVVGMLTYAHNAALSEYFLQKGLAAAGLDYADVLLLGWFRKRPSRKIIEGTLALQKRGLIRHIGLTSHVRTLFPKLAKENIFDVFHIRYNAVHRKAESETFPLLKGERRPGVVSFTATDWRKLLKPGRMPAGEHPPSAADCYRFALSHSSVDVCMMGARNTAQMQENLAALSQGPMAPEELERMRRIGDHIYNA